MLIFLEAMTGNFVAQRLRAKKNRPAYRQNESKAEIGFVPLRNCYGII
jgi:hypothetical protein